MGLKEMLAAKKAAMMKEVEPRETQIITAEDVGSLEAVLEIAGIDPAPAAVEPQAPPKAMTFAERMALKKAAATESATSANKPATEAEDVSASIVGRMLAVSNAMQPAELSEDQQAVIDGEDDSELAQAYSDIALQINSLSRTEDETALENAMAELKRALHKNPSASLLVLDSDIGQMVIALRKLTHVDLMEAATPKKKGSPKAKAVNLSSEDIQKAWDDL